MIAKMTARHVPLTLKHVLTLAFCLILPAIAVGQPVKTEGSPELWRQLKTDTKQEFTGAEIFSLATTLFIDGSSGLWDTWDTALTLTHYDLDVINSDREKIVPRFTDISYNTDSTGFICGEQGVLLQTGDWGRNWKQRYFENLDYLYFYGIEFGAPQHGVLCGVTGDETVRYKGIIYHTSDSGMTWTPARGVQGTGFSNVAYHMDSRTYTITAIGALLISKDDGATWEYIELPGKELVSSVILDGDMGLAIGKNGQMIRSGDAGKSWKVVKSPTSKDLFGSYRYGPGMWYIAGAGGQVWETRDAGENWTQLPTPTDARLNGVKRMGPKLFAWGADGTIMVRRIK